MYKVYALKEGDVESGKKFWRKKVKLCLNDKYKKAHGFIWKWYTEEEI